MTAPTSWGCHPHAPTTQLNAADGHDPAEPVRAAAADDFSSAVAARTTLARQVLPRDEGGETAFVNAKVFTSDPARPWAQALLVRGDRIAAVGSDDDILRRARTARVIDLDGATLIAGFNDAHLHHTPDPVGVRLTLVAEENPTTAELLAEISTIAKAWPSGTWIFGTMGEHNVTDGTLTRAALDRVAAGHPVILLGMSNHTNVLNTAAIAALGVPDDAGEDGRLDEYLQWNAQRAFAQMTSIDDGAQAIRGFSNQCLEFGVTTVQNMSWTPMERYLRMVDAADVPLRIRMIRFPTADESERLTQDRAQTHGGPRHLTVDPATKWILDGTFVERGADHGEPYADDPTTQGRQNFSERELAALIHESTVFDEQLLLHAIGRKTVGVALEALARSDIDPRDGRVRVEHGDGMTGAHLDRAKELGVTVVQNPVHFAFADMYAARYGAETNYLPFRSIVERGIPLGIGSDGPLNPFLGLMFAVIHPLRPDEAVSMEQAVTMYTHGSAVAERRGADKGRLAPGYLADLTVLSQDIFTIDPAALPLTRSALTMIGGEIVFTRPAEPRD